jgi:SEC-C motif-containing protein
MARSGRNAPCPCGSGRKYKLCCLERAAGERQRARTTDAVWARLQEWTIAEHAEHLDAAIEDLCGDDRSMSAEMVELLCSYAHLDRDLPGGGTPAERFREHPGLSDLERDAANRLAETQLGLWRARSVRPGATIELEEVLGDRCVSVRSNQISRATRRWDVLLGRVILTGSCHELWGPAAIFEAAEEEEIVAEIRRLASEYSIPPLAAFRVCAGQLLRFSPPSRHTPPSFFTFEGDEVAHAHARWALSADADASVLECHPDIVDMANTDDGEGICLEWTAPRAELAARRPALPARAVLLESTPMFVDADGAHVRADGGRIGLGTFELRPRSLTFDAISTRRLDGAIALVADALGDRAHLLERHVEPLELDGAPPPQPPNGSEAHDPSVRAEVREAVLAAYGRDRSAHARQPDPRFDGLTPREAARSSSHRSGLERWLQTLENSAAHGRADDTMTPDVATIRRELAMADDAA